MGDHAGWPVQQGLSRCPGARRGPGRRGESGLDLRPARTAASPTSASPAPRSRRCRPTRWPRCIRQLDLAPDGDHRRVGWVTHLDAHRRPAPRGRRRAGASGGSVAATFGLMSLGVHYCGQSPAEGLGRRHGGCRRAPGVGRGDLRRNPSNRQRFLDQDRLEFIATMEEWMLAYCPCGDELVPGLPSAAAARARPARARVPQRRERRVPHAR